LSTELNRILQTLFASNANTNNKPTVLVISTGTWDVADRNISLFVQFGLPALEQFFDAVQNYLDANRMRIVMLTAPAFQLNGLIRATHSDHMTAEICVTTLL
jgi:hypothetical protein